MNLWPSVLAMVFASDVWAVYGVIVRSESICTDCFFSPIVRTNATMDPSLSTSTPLPSSASITFAPSYRSSVLGSPTLEPSVAPVISSLPTQTAKPTRELRPEIKIGIGIGAGVLGLALLIVVFEACYFRRRRRQKALVRAVEEVERGIDKGSEERIVLESRVSIVFEDDGLESDEQDDEDDEEEEEERGRNGMSLPRRD